MQIVSTLLKIIFCSFLLFSHLIAFIDYIVLEKENKMILIIGDAESENLNHINEAHVKWFVNVLNRHTPKTPINMIYNISEDTLKLIQNRTESELQIPQTFLHLAKKASIFDGSNIFVSTFDCRGKESELIDDFFAKLTTKLSNNDLGSKEWKSIKRKWSNEIKKSSLSIDKKLFLESLNINEEKLQNWMDTYEIDSFEYKLFEELILKYKNSILELSEFLKDKPNEDIRLNILSPLNGKTKIDLNNKCRKLAQMFCLESDFVFTDLAFLHEILDKLNNGFNKVIFIAPWARKKNLAQMLNKVGYTTTSKFSAIEYNELEHHAKIQFAGYKKLPMNLLSALHVLLDVDKTIAEMEMVEIIKNSEAPQKICNHCHTKGFNNNLSVCSQCKQIYYCNRICQKNDWPKHKNICKKTN